MRDKLNRRVEWLVSGNLASLWGSMTRNWTLKLICLLLAFVAWQGIRESTSYEVVVSDIPVSISAGPNRAVLDLSTDVVSIRFRGSRDDLRFINRDQVSVEIDLSERTDSLKQTIKFTPRYVKAPSSAHAVLFAPSEITVTIDREVVQDLPVKASMQGALPDGIHLEKVVCNPATVRIRGAESRLLDLEQVHTVPVSMAGRYDSFQTHAAIAAGQFWNAEPDRVSVEVSLVERFSARRIENLLVRPLMASDDSRVVQVRPERVDVVLNGSPQQLEQLDSEKVYSYVDCTDLTEPTTYEVPVRLDLPPGIVTEKTEPSVVEVTVKPR